MSPAVEARKPRRFSEPVISSVLSEAAGYATVSVSVADPAPAALVAAMTPAAWRSDLRDRFGTGRPEFFISEIPQVAEECISMA